MCEEISVDVPLMVIWTVFTGERVCENVTYGPSYLLILYMIAHWLFILSVASLLNVPGQSALRALFSRHTHLQFSYLTLLCILPIFFFLACWAAGSAVASGIVVPML